MPWSLYVNNIPAQITSEKLIIYFQSSKSGGGDVDSDATIWNGDNAVVVFEEKEYLDSVLRRKHEIDGYRLQISDKPLKARPVPKKRKKTPAPKAKEKIQPDDEKSYLGEVRTIIVSGLCPDTTDETLEMFFENSKRSGGGEIENIERCHPDVAHITFVSAEVAAQVLKQVKLELQGYLLQLKEKQPELILPLDRKKLYVENIDPKTTKDSLWNYIEVRAKMDVCDIEFGENGSALVIFNEEPDMKKILENKKRLEGAALKISNPPVCNGILVTGLTKNTTKEAIEMYFENEKNGGGKIYGDIIYQKTKGKAVISFCDPQVLQTTSAKEQKLNGSVLSVYQHYQFMERISETSSKIIKVNTDVLDHAIKNCEKEIRDRFGSDLFEIFNERREELMLPSELANDVEEYMEQFTVKEIQFCQKLLDTSREELKLVITTVNKYNITIAIEKEMPQIKVVGKKEDIDVIYEQLKYEIAKMEKGLDVVTDQLSMHGYKLELFLLHGVDEMLKNEFHVDVKIEPSKKTITIKGSKEQVSLAAKEAYKKCTQIAEDNIDLNETKKRFLESGGLDMLNNGMKATGLKGIVSLSESKTNKVKVLVFDDATIKDVHSYLSSNMFVEQYLLDEDSLALLNSNKWKEFLENVTKNTSVLIYTSGRSSTEISLIGQNSEVEETYETLQQFMKRNTIVKESVDLNEGYVGYLTKYCAKDLEEIGKKLEEHSVRMHLMEQEGTVNILGTKEGVKEAKKQMEGIISNIARDKICFDKLRNQNYLESDEGKLSMNGIESNHKCSIRLIKDDGERSTIIPSFRPKQPSKLLCSDETQEKISLKVFKDDITAHGCDVIVNAANGDLKHIGGVAKSILDTGGNEIQDECDAYVKAEGSLFEGECFSGSPGKLPCKRLIHAVGPRWDNSKREKICKTLSVTCTRALEEARDYRSIAIPAIGSGIYGIPKDICANIMIDAAEEFGKKYDNCALKEIRFVNIDDTTSQVFLKKFREKFGGRSSFKDNQGKTTGRRFGSSVPRSQAKESKREEKDVTAEVLPRRKPGDFITTKGGMKISVAVGDLSTYKADVLVNTTGENLKLDSNPCGKALSNEAGPTLQAECTKIGNLQVGQVAVTQGGNLLCDEVYHVVCVQWNGDQGEQVLRSIIKNCLKKCNSNRKKSIAFPAIGTGILSFPHDVAAKIFFEETKEFEKRITNCTIKEVSFVVYNQDAKSIEAFKNELKKQAEWDNSGLAAIVPVVSPTKKWRTKRGSSKKDSRSISKSSLDEADNSVMCIQVGEDKEVEIVKGDITKETTDVIAHLTNPDMSLQGGVAMALTRAGGLDIERECQNKVDSTKLQIATTVLTTAGRLDAKYVAHMVASNDPSSNEIEKCISNCLEAVSKKECESISFPAVGTGSLKHDPEKAATAIFTSVVRFLESSPGPLKTVRIVLKDDEIVTAFQASAKRLNEDEAPGMFKRFVNYFLKSDSTTISVKEKAPVIRKKLFLEIYAKDEVTVNRAKDRILKIMESQNKKDKLEDDNIGKLSQQQINEIKHLCEMNDIKVTIERELNRIVVVGHGDDISKTFAEIHKLLKRIGEEEKEREKAALHADLAEMVSQGVQWFCVDPKSGDCEEYDKQINVIIEKAYSKKEKSVIFLLDDEKCEIVFDKMEETNLDTNETIKVIRKDLKAEVSVPEYWEAQPQDANGKESTVHLVLLNPNDPNQKNEYKKISDHFLQTASQQQIVQIQRIQNPSLFKLYLMKKQSLDEKSGSNEKFLFHGTKGDKLNEINEKGLNRSYAGNAHGAVFGKGVYFARDASMSVGYSPAMSNGKRYMYYTRVAVGQYAVGNGSMVVPPQKGGNSNDSYDSTVNNLTSPTIFVLFYDNQYYPEYLITFT